MLLQAAAAARRAGLQISIPMQARDLLTTERRHKTARSPGEHFASAVTMRLKHLLSFLLLILLLIFSNICE